MKETVPVELTQMLSAWSGGDRTALEKILPLVYDNLRDMARRQLNRERIDHTLDATALVHEAYLRLVARPNVHWENRAHFFAAAAILMRHILVDHARRKRSLKRGGPLPKLSLDASRVMVQDKQVDLLALDDALKQLEALDQRQCRVVELRFFAGLTVEEVADALGISPATVKTDWEMARAWLFARLRKR